MGPPVPPSASADGLMIGRSALRQLRASLLRDATDAAIPILQEVGFAAGEGVYQAFCTWLPAARGVARPGDLDSAELTPVLSEFFRAMGWGSVHVAALGNAALALDSVDWVEADPGTAETPMCFFSSGMLADFLGRLSGEAVAVMEVECRSRNDARCRFISAAPETLNEVYERMAQGQRYEEVLGAEA